MSEKSKTKLIWLKYGTLVACFCLIVISAFSCHLYAKQYVVDNSILVHNTASVIDSDCEVTPEQAEQLAIANSIHNNLSVQNFEWYGNCYYDLQKDKIMLGLTVISDSNKEIVRPYIRNNTVEFYECDYSYQYLEKLYNKLNEKRIILNLLGADRFNIYIEKNRVNVHLTNTANYMAICLANKLDTFGGAIIFCSDTAITDGDCSTQKKGLGKPSPLILS